MLDNPEAFASSAPAADTGNAAKEETKAAAKEESEEEEDDVRAVLFPAAYLLVVCIASRACPFRSRTIKSCLLGTLRAVQGGPPLVFAGLM